MTLRLRLVAIIGLSLALLWGAVALWMFVDVRRELRMVLDERLAASARMVAGLVARLPPEHLREAASPAVPLDVVAHDGLACEVSFVRGEASLRPIARTFGSPGLEQAGPGYATRTIGGRAWRVYVLEAGGVRIATADRLEVREGLLREIALAAAAPFAVAMAGSLRCCGSASDAACGRSSACAGRCSTGRPTRRRRCPTSQAPPELQPLIDTVGHLLLRVQAAIARERRFTDDAAHELRTPLTAVKTHLQVLRLAGGDGALGDTARQALADAQSGVVRLQRTLEQLLLLARLEAAPDGDPAAEPADAEEAARQAIDEATAGNPQAAADRRIELLAPPGQAAPAVPEALLVAALRNLLDNALRHAPRAPVVLGIERSAAAVVFRVADRGPGMAPDELAQATQRFWRRGGQQAGSGLGLSIVDAIARRHGGTLALSGRDGGGLEACLRLPAVWSDRG